MASKNVAMPTSTASPDAIIARLGPLVTENVFVEHRTFLIRRPSESDKPIGAESPAAYTPFWADLWPGARMLAKYRRRMNDLLHKATRRVADAFPGATPQVSWPQAR